MVETRECRKFGPLTGVWGMMVAPECGGLAFSGSLSPWERVGVRVEAPTNRVARQSHSGALRLATPLTPDPSPRGRGEEDGSPDR
jgi:hypothetical protein